jgi:aminopeptidase
MLEADEGARRVGEFAIGTNPGIQHITREILFDEKINGSFHMALGKGYPESGSRNDSAIHWDMICDLRQGGRIWVDDELLYEDGRFVLDFWRESGIWPLMLWSGGEGRWSRALC